MMQDEAMHMSNEQAVQILKPMRDMMRDQHGCPISDAYFAIEKAIRVLTTISPDDVRGVVHCKDCKWCHAGYCEKYDDLIPFGCANKPWEDWFCADGKRQETIKEEQDED